MWEQIGAAAIYGAIGGGAGALLGATLASLFRNTRFASIATAGLTAAGAVLGLNLAEPLLKPYIGQYLPQAANNFDDQFDEMVVELEKYPTTAAIFEREPRLKNSLKAQLADAMKEATNASAARVQAFSVSYNIVSGRVVSYFAKAQDADLITMMTTTVTTLDDLAGREPEFCFEYLYAPHALASKPADYFRNKIGPELFDRQQEEIATLVRNAYDDIPEYDQTAAQAGLNKASVILGAELGEKIGLVTGQLLPEGEEDAKLACSATANMYRLILEQPDAALIGRHIFSLSS